MLLVWSGLEARGWVFLLLTVWFAVGGAVLGLLLRDLEAWSGFSESWPLTFEDEPEGPVWLAVFEEVDEPGRARVAHTHALEMVTDRNRCGRLVTEV